MQKNILEVLVIVFVETLLAKQGLGVEFDKVALLNQYCRCFGPGSCPSNRVTWARELVDEEADQFLQHSYIDPDPQRPWLAQRMALRIPYSAQKFKSELHGADPQQMIREYIDIILGRVNKKAHSYSFQFCFAKILKVFHGVF